MSEDKLKHVYAVGLKMMELGEKRNMTEEELQDLFILGLLHDIGYQFGTSDNHNIVGGTLLKNNNYKYWKEVYYHTVPDSEYKSIYLDILNAADMMIDMYGNEVGFKKRLEDIKSRYGENSKRYLDCVKVVNELEKNKSLL